MVMRNGRIVTIDSPRGLQRQAMGGEVIHLQVEPAELLKCMRFLDDQPRIIKVERAPGETDGLYIFVEDAGKQLPHLLSVLKEQQTIVPQNAEPYFPSFDEVFVRIIRASEQSQKTEIVQ